MEEYAQELEIPDVSLSPDIQPYMIEPTASQDQQENNGTEDNSSSSDDSGQTTFFSQRCWKFIFTCFSQILLYLTQHLRC